MIMVARSKVKATSIIIIIIILCFQFSHSYSPMSTLGLHPLDDKYYGKEVIKCKDGSKSFTRDRLNDDYCDCTDGTDEPGTSACPAGKFYCRNVGSKPRILFSSRVNDHICDCCDGSDEYDGTVTCPNTCIMGGFVYQKVNYDSLRGSVNSRKSKSETNTEESTYKLQGLKAVVILQVVSIIVFVALKLFKRRKTRRRSLR